MLTAPTLLLSSKESSLPIQVDLSITVTYCVAPGRNFTPHSHHIQTKYRLGVVVDVMQISLQELQTWKG